MPDLPAIRETLLRPLRSPFFLLALALAGVFVWLAASLADDLAVHQTAEGGKYVRVAARVPAVWAGDAWEDGRPWDRAMSAAFSIVPPDFGEKPLFIAAVAYTRHVGGLIGIDLGRPDRVLNTAALGASAIGLFFVLGRFTSRAAASVGALVYGFSLINLSVALQGFHSTPGIGLVIAAMTVAVRRPGAWRLLVAGLLIGASAFTSPHAVPLAAALLLYLGGDTLRQAWPVGRWLERLRSVAVQGAALGLGMLLPFAFFLGRDLWVGAKFDPGRYGETAQWSPYVLQNFRDQARMATAQDVPSQPLYYWDYLRALDGDVLAMAVVVALATSIVALVLPATRPVRPLLGIAAALGVPSWLILTFGDLPPVGRAYLPLAVVQAFVLAAVVWAVGRWAHAWSASRPRFVAWCARRGLSGVIVVGMAVAVALATVSHVDASRTAVRFTPDRLPAVVDSGADVLTVDGLRDALSALRRCLDADRPTLVWLPAPLTRFAHHDFGEPELWAFFASLEADGGLQPVETPVAANIDAVFINEHAYYNFLKGGARRTFADDQWPLRFAWQEGRLYRLEDVHAAYDAAGLTLYWTGGHAGAELGFRRLAPAPAGAADMAVVAGPREGARAWRLDGSGGLALWGGDDGVDTVTGLASLPASQLTIGLWVRLPAQVGPEAVPLLALGRPGIESITLTAEGRDLVLRVGGAVRAELRGHLKPGTWQLVSWSLDGKRTRLMVDAAHSEPLLSAINLPERRMYVGQTADGTAAPAGTAIGGVFVTSRVLRANVLAEAAAARIVPPLGDADAGMSLLTSARLGGGVSEEEFATQNLTSAMKIPVSGQATSQLTVNLELEFRGPSADGAVVDFERGRWEIAQGRHRLVAGGQSVLMGPVAWGAEETLTLVFDSTLEVLVAYRDGRPAGSVRWSGPLPGSIALSDRPVVTLRSWTAWSVALTAQEVWRHVVRGRPVARLTQARMDAIPALRDAVVISTGRGCGVGQLDDGGPASKLTFFGETVDGPFGEAFRLDGLHAFAEAPAVEGWEALTVALWVRPDPRPDGGQAIVVDSAHTGAEGFVLQSTAEDSATYDWHAANTDLRFSIPPRVWSHVALVADRARNELRAYVNGSLAGATETAGPIVFTSSSLYFGRWATGGRGFRGDLDEIAIWRRVLSPEEVRELYEDFLLTVEIVAVEPER